MMVYTLHGTTVCSMHPCACGIFYYVTIDMSRYVCGHAVFHTIDEYASASERTLGFSILAWGPSRDPTIAQSLYNCIRYVQPQ